MDRDVSDTGAATASPPDDRAARQTEFARFYRQEMSGLVAFLIVLGATPIMAADVAQEAMTAAYRDWSSVDRPREWVRTAASRHWSRLTLNDQAATGPGGAGQAEILTADQSDEIVRKHTFLAALPALSARERQIMAWTLDGYRPAEIAALLTMPAESVRSELRAARRTLARQRQMSGEKS